MAQKEAKDIQEEAFWHSSVSTYGYIRLCVKVVSEKKPEVVPTRLTDDERHSATVCAINNEATRQRRPTLPG